MRILIVEDDQKIAGFIAERLRREGHEVQLATDGVAGVDLASQRSPAFDALVLDLMLPKLDGFGVLETLRRQGMVVPVLMLSALDSVDDRVRGLRAGADDYLIKPFAFDELTARLLAISRRAASGHEIGFEPTRLSFADLTLDRLNRHARRGDTDIELQPKEFALLEYFLCNVGRTVTKAMILEHVWHWRFDPRTNLVDVLVSRVRTKIDRDFEPKLIRTLRGIGYVLRAD